MKKKRKLWIPVLLLVLVFVVFGGSSEPKETKEIVAEGETKEISGEEENVSAQNTSITIEEQVLFDRNGIVVTAKEYVTDSIWGDGIFLLLENNSDKTVGVSCDALIVNDYMITDLFSSEVAPGKKANETMYLSSSELKAAGIDSVGQVEIYFYVYDSDTYETLFKVDKVTIQTTEFANMDTTPEDSGNELYNKGGIRIVGKTVNENSFWGTAILLYSENTSGRNVGISVEEMSVNGFMVNPAFSTTVYDGKKSIDDITVFSSDLEENEIEAIEEVELKFHIYDIESYDTIADSEAITFKAQ